MVGLRRAYGQTKARLPNSNPKGLFATHFVNKDQKRTAIVKSFKSCLYPYLCGQIRKNLNFYMNTKKILSDLGIDKMNAGTSTGAKWSKGSGSQLDSYSPVD